ncbi:MAG: hypothetical protein CTY19_01480 [Methylomonas sp.]|nr:MAG: hypothetical protein CTY19_01480 [Methylomonas sp.]
MLQLVYVSSATTPFSNAELLELLTKSRIKNSKLGITGMLLYKDGNFMQLLEGEDNTVRQLFETISHDPRHHNSIVLIDEPAETAYFGDWSMGFRDLSDKSLETLPGFSQILNRPKAAEFQKFDGNDCWELLKMFKDNC